MSDFSVIFICISAMVIAYFVFNIIKSGKAANMKANVKDGTIEFGSIKEKEKELIKKENTLVDESFKEPAELSYLLNKDDGMILDYYKTKKLDNKITSLTVYKEYSNIISQSTLEVQSMIISYIAKNHILEKSPAEFEEYIKEKIRQIRDVYNSNLFSSSIESIKKLKIETICGFYQVTLINLIKDIYNSVYKNHTGQEDLRAKYLEGLLKGGEAGDLNRRELLQNYNSCIISNFTETVVNDSKIVLENIKYMQSFLLGIFHDALKQRGV